MLRIRSLAPVTLALLLAGMAQAQEATPGDVQEREVLAMGTRLSLRLEGPPGTDLAAASSSALDECARIEAACSTWQPGSDWSRLNAAAGASVRLDPEWLALLSRALDWNRRTEGAFDPVLGKLLACYGVRSGGRIPSAAEVKAACASSGSRLLHLDPSHGTARLDRGAAIEEGGFVKGYALDRMLTKLKPQGVHSGFLDFGGQILAFGIPRQVSIADPENRYLPRFTVALEDTSLASSGFSEHGAHIVDPRTGLMCEDWGSVSVIAPSALDADCLSTALYVLGPEQGLAWATRHSIPAIFLLKNGAARMSPAFQSLHPTSRPTEQP